MSIDILLPSLPESVSDALLMDWHKSPGDTVHRDELLVEVETDKIVLEIVAPEDGVLTEILQPKGSTVTAGEVLARIDTQVKSVAQAKNTIDATEHSTPPVPDEESPTSPAVRKLVAQHGLNLDEIDGSGPDGRVTKEDIINFIGDQVVPSTPPKESKESESSKESKEPEASKESESSKESTAVPHQASNEQVATRATSREPMSRLRQTIAGRLVQSQQTAALLTTFNEVNMQEVIDLRTKYGDEFEKTHGARLGFMSFFVKASVKALAKFPLVNACIDGTDIVRHDYCDISIAVSSPRGLVVPVIRDCERLSFADIESRIRELGGLAQTGKISMDDLIGGTFTITNGGIFGSLLSMPIVNPPQSAILGMHKIEQRPIAENDQVVIRPMMYLALSYDHRIIDGKEAVQFLLTVKEQLESPARILLDI